MPRWNDFVIVILNAWSQALLRIVRAESAAERVYFMEGPYHVELTPSGNGQVRLKAIARPSTERTHEDISESELLANLLEVVATMLEAAHKSGDTSPDVLQLEALLQELHSARELSLLSGE